MSEEIVVYGKGEKGEKLELTWFGSTSVEAIKLLLDDYGKAGDEPDHYVLNRDSISGVLLKLKPVKDYVNLLSPKKRIALEVSDSESDPGQELFNILSSAGGFESYAEWKDFYDLIRFYGKSEIKELEFWGSY